MRCSRILTMGIIFLKVVSSDEVVGIWHCISWEWCFTVSDYLTTNNGEAKSFCSSFGATLASISAPHENKYVARLCGSQSCWIGLEERSEGDWFWLDGSTSEYRQWSGDEPNNHGGENEMVTVMNIVIPQDDLHIVDSGWYDVGIGFNQAAAICRIRKAEIRMSQEEDDPTSYPEEEIESVAPTYNNEEEIESVAPAYNPCNCEVDKYSTNEPTKKTVEAKKSDKGCKTSNSWLWSLLFLPGVCVGCCITYCFYWQRNVEKRVNIQMNEISQPQDIQHHVTQPNQQMHQNLQHLPYQQQSNQMLQQPAPMRYEGQYPNPKQFHVNQGSTNGQVLNKNPVQQLNNGQYRNPPRVNAPRVNAQHQEGLVYDGRRPKHTPVIVSS